MDLEAQRRRIRRLSWLVATCQMMWMASYFIVRATAIHLHYHHGASTVTMMNVGLLAFVVSTVVGIAGALERRAGVARYNAEVLEQDPRLLGEHIPILR
jgi:hypothetical protein